MLQFLMRRSLFSVLICLLFTQVLHASELCDFLTGGKTYPGSNDLCDQFYKEDPDEEYKRIVLGENPETAHYLEAYVDQGKIKYRKTTARKVGGHVAQIVGAYALHLGSHELGHHAAAQMYGAEEAEMHFFYKDPEDGEFYFGYASHKGLPEESRLSVSAAGAFMEQVMFNFALENEQHNPSTFNKSLMFFSTVNFVGYTLYANYVEDENMSYDPNKIRDLTGLSKTALTTVVVSKALVNTVRYFKPDLPIIPNIMVGEKEVGLIFSVPF